MAITYENNDLESNSRTEVTDEQVAAIDAHQAESGDSNPGVMRHTVVPRVDIIGDLSETSPEPIETYNWAQMQILLRRGYRMRRVNWENRNAFIASVGRRLVRGNAGSSRVNTRVCAEADHEADDWVLFPNQDENIQDLTVEEIAELNAD